MKSKIIVVCPKCSGQDVYYGVKQELKGVGGIYGNKAVKVRRPICRNCDIEAIREKVLIDGSPLIPWSTRKKVAFFVGLFFLLILFISIFTVLMENFLY